MVVLESDQLVLARSRALLEEVGFEVVPIAACADNDASCLSAAASEGSEPVGPSAPPSSRVRNDSREVERQSPRQRALDAAFGTGCRCGHAQSAELEMAGWILASVAHDLNNAITALSAQLFVAHSRLGPALPMAECQAILEHCTRLAKRLLFYSTPRERQVPMAPKTVDLRGCVSDALRIVSPLLPSRIRVEPALEAEPAFVSFDPELIINVVINLVLNARDALPHGGNIYVAIRRLAGGRHELSVADSGVGMAPETLECAFDPFFTTKSQGAGLGLGLSAVRRTIEAAGGSVTLSSELGKGTAVTIVLPRVDPEQDAGAGDGQTLRWLTSRW